jgi:hypothetical protein
VKHPHRERLVVAAFHPWLRFETMLFSAIEKAFMVYLFLGSLNHPWAMGYILGFVVDSTIVAYSTLYFISDQGRPRRWTISGPPIGKRRVIQDWQDPRSILNQPAASRTRN